MYIFRKESLVFYHFVSFKENGEFASCIWWFYQYYVWHFTMKAKDFFVIDVCKSTERGSLIVVRNMVTP